ncbi:MAG TPA: DNA polymerase III subunit delta [Spirochaetota bacterium]|nr:DNA polymerase III subunit delta [Spirochaetota bacterium]HPJ34553.1 DNA polymerase III subunit delta [Spirochaetota bacterium]
MSRKKYPTSRQFASEIKKGLKHSIYLFLGEAEGDKDKLINQMLDQFFTDPDERRNSTGRFFINQDKNSAEELLSAADFAMAGSMFSQKRVCIIRNFENLKAVENNKAMVNDMIDGLAEGTVMIITSSQNKPPAMLEKLPDSVIHIVQFWKQFDSDLFNFIKKSLNERNIRIDERLIRLILELTGNDIRKIDELIDMISYSAGDIELDASVIRDLAGDVREMNVFDFTDTLFRKEKKSLFFLRRLIEEGTAELLLLNMILRQADTLEKYYGYIDSKLGQDEALLKLGLASSKLRREKFLEVSRRFTRENLRKLYPLAARTEYMLKSGSSGSSLAGNPVFILATEIIAMK